MSRRGPEQGCRIDGLRPRKPVEVVLEATVGSLELKSLKDDLPESNFLVEDLLALGSLERELLENEPSSKTITRGRLRLTS